MKHYLISLPTVAARDLSRYFRMEMKNVPTTPFVQTECTGQESDRLKFVRDGFEYYVPIDSVKVL